MNAARWFAGFVLALAAAGPGLTAQSAKATFKDTRAQWGFPAPSRNVIRLDRGRI